MALMKILFCSYMIFTPSSLTSNTCSGHRCYSMFVVHVCAGVMLRFVTSYWGSRVSVMLGGVLSATGLALCMMVQELYQLYLAFGLLVGEFRHVDSYQPYPASGLLVGEFRCVNSISAMVYQAFGLHVGEFRHVNSASGLRVGEFKYVNSINPTQPLGCLECKLLPTQPDLWVACG